MTRIYDAHAHLGSEAERRVRREQDIVTMVCAGTPAQAERLSKEAARNANILPAAGLHPWHCDKCSVEEMRPFLERVPVIGEIGLDSVWCQIPMEIQRRAFEAQLALAAQMGKPVVLHTKGMEAEIARTIKKYENTYLVHWYSSMEHLEDYLALDCYFTLGPDLASNPAVRQVAERAGADRLMVETDGFSAAVWALGEMELSALPGLLRGNMELAAQIKGLPPEEMALRMEKNFRAFTKTSLQ